jgi:hypothetical protein
MLGSESGFAPDGRERAITTPSEQITPVNALASLQFGSVASESG